MRKHEATGIFGECQEAQGMKAGEGSEGARC